MIGMICVVLLCLINLLFIGWVWFGIYEERKVNGA